MAKVMAVVMRAMQEAVKSLDDCIGVVIVQLNMRQIRKRSGWFQEISIRPKEIKALGSQYLF
jgi:hypothetical protein